MRDGPQDHVSYTLNACCADSPVRVECISTLVTPYKRPRQDALVRERRPSEVYAWVAARKDARLVSSTSEEPHK